MVRRHDGEIELEQPEAAPASEPAPAPAVVPGSLAWASSVGNQAVARYARDQVVGRQAEEEGVEADDESPEAVEDSFPDEELVGDVAAPAEGPAEEVPVDDDALPA